MIEPTPSVSEFEIEGLTFRSGDLICTTDGRPEVLVGEFWRLIGRLVPGPVDHVIIYVGPGGKCVEAGARGVVQFELTGPDWEASKMMADRGPFIDTFYGGVFPLQRMARPPEEEAIIRLQIREYCLKQARLKKPYNINFLNPETERSFYCSQLAYKAYQKHGINLNTGMNMPELRGSEKIVFPQEIWLGHPHQMGHSAMIAAAQGLITAPD